MTRDKKIANYIEAYLNKKKENTGDFDFCRNNDRNFTVCRSDGKGFEITFPHIKDDRKGDLPCHGATDKAYAKALVKAAWRVPTARVCNGQAIKQQYISKYFAKEIAKIACKMDENIDTKDWAKQLSAKYHVEIKAPKLNSCILKIKIKEEGENFELEDR